jgi:signal transduction histidine kinase
MVFELDFRGEPPGRRGSFPSGPRQTGALIVELDPDYLRSVVLPDALKHHLGAGGVLDYQAEVLTQTNPPSIVYRSDPAEPKGVAASADASIGFFNLQFDPAFQTGGRAGDAAPGRGRGPGDMRDPGPGRGPGGGFGRWQLFVRHRAGSLEAVVYRSRMRNLAVTSGVLLLMFASLAAIVRFTRRSQKLAELQMEFVAGVSHELWTPLTVISTAGYNLRGKLSRDPAQVERYGALIQQESGRLKDLVGQVLRFAGANAGRVVGEFEPLSAEHVIADAIESSRFSVEVSQCAVETTIEPGLPLLLGDPVSLKHALQNLIVNAAKYGTKGSNWIGVFASKAAARNGTQVEIRVVDRGPGIPSSEQRHIFDPFFRGKRALQNQIHGTGLGLSLAKRIVEAHGGAIAVRSEPAGGTEFVVRLPIAPPEDP